VTEQPARLRVLVVEDAESDAELIVQELRRSGFDPVAQRVDTRAQAEQALTEPWDVVITDYSLPSFGALPFLSLLKERGLDVPTIVASGSVGEEDLIEAMRAGAHDYVLKSNLGRLGPAVRRELEDAAAREARRAAERALRESEERFRFMVEHSGDVLYRLRFGNMAYDYMSPGIERLTGYSLEEINELGFTSLVLSITGPAASHVVRQELLMERQAGKSYEFWADYRIQTKSGELRWVADHSLPWRDDSGEVIGSIGILSDITRRKDAEEALKVSEARVRIILDSALDAVIGMDQSGVVTYWNPRAESIFGWPRPLAVGRTVAELIIPERQREAHVQGLKRFLGTGEGPLLERRLELTAVRADGSEFPVELVVTAVRRSDTWSFHAFAADISERKRAEEAMRRSEEHFRSLIENALDVIAVVDASGRFTYESPSIERVLGYRPQELVGQDALTLVHPEDVASVRDTFGSLAGRPGGVVSGRARLRHKDGTWRSFEAVGKLEQGRGGRVILNARDVTDREHLESQLRQSQKMEAVGRLAGGVAHDFNNLITAISGYAELTLKRMDADDPRARNMTEIRKAAYRAAALTRQLLAFGRKQVLRPQVLDLSDTVEQVDGLLRRLIGEDVELRIHKGGRCGRVRADPSQVEQVLINLAINARDAMPSGGRLTIEMRDVELHQPPRSGPEEPTPGDYVMIAVADTGHGMDLETQSHIFEPFFTTKAVGQGTGLGLSTVYGIVKQSGGHIVVESEPGQGATFKVYLPRVLDDGHETLEPVRAAPARPAQGGGSETILLVEDDAAIRDMLREILTDEGYTVLVAQSPEDALRIVRERTSSIDALISDVVMPMMTGPELATRIAELRPGIKVLFMSGYTARAVADRGLVPDARQFLQKPFTSDTLISRLRELLEGR
jgi:two-component system, cell cycle sensor histidine kinase and response regulator CckA